MYKRQGVQSFGLQPNFILGWRSGIPVSLPSLDYRIADSNLQKWTDSICKCWLWFGRPREMSHNRLNQDRSLSEIQQLRNRPWFFRHESTRSRLRRSELAESWHCRSESHDSSSLPEFHCQWGKTISDIDISIPWMIHLFSDEYICIYMIINIHNDIFPNLIHGFLRACFINL